MVLIRCESKELLIAGTSVLVVITILASVAAYCFSVTAYAQKGSSSSDKPGNVLNSLYLSITDHKYRTGSFSDTITGTIVNNSTSEISSLNVYAALYDKDNKLITMDSGSVSISPLRAGDSSPFDITIFIPSSARNQIDHYTLFPGGTPS